MAIESLHECPLCGVVLPTRVTNKLNGMVVRFPPPLIFIEHLAKVHGRNMKVDYSGYCVDGPFYRCWCGKEFTITKFELLAHGEPTTIPWPWQQFWKHLQEQDDLIEHIVQGVLEHGFQ